VTSKAPPKQIFGVFRIGLGLGRSVLPCQHVITDDRPGSARFRLGNALFFDVQPPDSPEVRISETADDLQTDPLPGGRVAGEPYAILGA